MCHFNRGISVNIQTTFILHLRLENSNLKGNFYQKLRKLNAFIVVSLLYSIRYYYHIWSYIQSI